MIIEFSVQNHRSIKSEQRLSFVASNYDKSLPDNVITLDLPDLGETKLVKAIALYGPNAGGKSNAFSALKFLRWLVVESASGQKPEAKLPITPFGLDEESRNQPTVLTLTFIVEATRYELAVAFNSQRIVQERLVAYPTGKAQVWYDRVWDEAKGEYDWNPILLSDFQLDAGLIQRTRENALFVSTAAQWNDAKLKPIYQWFVNRLEFFDLGVLGTMSNEWTARLMHKSEDFKQTLSLLLRTADLGLSNVEVAEEEIKSEAGLLQAEMNKILGIVDPPQSEVTRRLKVDFEHIGHEGKLFPLNWSDQSAGTQRYFSLLGYWIAADILDEVICVDELETSLHPLLAVELIRLLMQRREHGGHAQLFFTTHNPLLLDQTVLRRDQVWFADKDEAGATFLYPLTDYKPRADESLVRGYLSGRYGAVPFIPNGLMGESSVAEKTPEAAHAG